MRIAEIILLSFFFTFYLSSNALTIQRESQLVTEDEKNTVFIFEKVSPSVVHINAKQNFNIKFEEITPKSGLGTGFFIDKNGHILTNYHIIADSNVVEIFLNTGEKFKGILVGTAPEFDLAVLKIEIPQEKISPVKLGDSEKIKVGQKVLAIGHPLALHNTLTVGVVSALNREAENLELSGQLIQIDAALNPGNSGGPLLNSKGEVTGICTAIAGSAQNIGFAIPINIASRILPDLIKMGHTFRPWLGFTGIGLNSYIAELFKIPLNEGVLVQKVIEGSPAYYEGLKGGNRIIVLSNQEFILGGDIITEINGIKIKSLPELVKIFLNLRPGNQADFTVFREGSYIHIKINIVQMVH